MTDRENVIKGLECCTKKPCIYKDTVEECPYCDMCDEYFEDCTTALAKDAISLLKTQEPADYIPIDWLMNYAQLPTEFAISAWRKPKKEAEIKQAKSLDKPMSFDDALALLKVQEPMKPIERNGFYYCGSCRYAFTVNKQKYCSNCGQAVKWE